jgi:hypothetical protein
VLFCLAALTRLNSKINIVLSEEEQAMSARVAQCKAETQRRVQERRDRKRHERKVRGHDLNEDDFKDVGPQSEQEQAFEAQVQLNREEQDKMLQHLIIGLDEVKALADAAHTNLVKQGAMLEQVDNRMESMINNFKVANKRLKDILEESGGMSRWCPILICVIFLLCLAGYMFGLAK